MYKDVVQLLESVKDNDFQLVALYSMSIIRLSKLDKARLNSKFAKRVGEIFDLEGRLDPNISRNDPRPHQQQALDNAWKHLKAEKLCGFFFAFTLAQAVCVGTRFQKTLAYRECRDKYNSILAELGLHVYIEPDIA